MFFVKNKDKRQRKPKNLLTKRNFKYIMDSALLRCFAEGVIIC